jgi:hypothetical protein
LHGFHEESAFEEQSMKLAYCKPATAGPDSEPRAWTDVRLCFEQCRADAANQPARVARRLNRSLRRFAGALERSETERGGDDLFTQARRLEELAAYIRDLRAAHEDAARLQRNVTRLMHEVFRTPEWRRKFIAGL